MTLLENMVSPASLLPVATCCYKSVLWPEAYRKKCGGVGHRQLEEAETAQYIVRNLSLLCVFSVLVTN